MKRLIAILFLLIFVATFLKQYYPYLEYALNKDYIAEYLCVNKDKPELKCEGKCHLNKQLNKLKTKDNENSPIPSQNKEISSTLFFQPSQPICFAIITESDLKKSNYNSSFVSIFQLETPTPPPQVL